MYINRDDFPARMTRTNQYVTRRTDITRHKTDQAIERITLPTAKKEIQAYRTALESQVRPTTLSNYVQFLSKIVRVTKTPLSKMKNADIRQYFNTLAGMSNGTKYAAYQALRSYFCDYLRYDRMIEKDLSNRWENLMANIHKPTPSKRLLTSNDLLTPEDLDQLLKACRSSRDKALLLVLYETGARLSEVLSMEVGDINLSSHPVEIKIKHSKTEDKKGRRAVYLIRAESYLKQWLSEHPLNKGAEFYTSHTLVWVTEPTHGEYAPITTNAAGLLIDRLKKRAGIPKKRAIFAHLFRHSRASDLHQNYGLDVKEIKELLGHSKIETTDGYLTLNRNVMIQKLEGKSDEALEARKAEALKRGNPLPCACGVTNDPQAAFCYACNRVVNPEVARELMKQRSEERKELEALKAHMETLTRTVSKMIREDLRETQRT